MNDFTKNIAQALFNQDKINDLLRQEIERAVNDLLEAELTAFFGYDPYARSGWNSGNSRIGAYYRKIDTQFGEIEIQVPRDRNGKFHQHTLPDYKQHSDVLKDMVIKLYSKGVTTREIADLIEKMYGSHYSAIGIKPNGRKKVIDYCIAPNENIEVWTEMLQNMKSRGLKQVELFLSDGVVGMKQTPVEAYPKAYFQRCLVHVMRNICANNREAVMNDFYAKWGKLYSHVVRNLKAIEADMLVFYNYPKQIRPSIYSTNMIESFNHIVKRKAKPKAEFPTEQSLDTFIGIQALSYNDRYFNRIQKGFGQVQVTLESYFD